MPPFDVESITRYTHIAYLDTIGRPAFVLKSSQLTDQHTGIIYVSNANSLSSFTSLTGLRQGILFCSTACSSGKTSCCHNCRVWLFRACDFLTSYRLPYYFPQCQAHLKNIGKFSGQKLYVNVKASTSLVPASELCLLDQEARIRHSLHHISFQ